MERTINSFFHDISLWGRLIKFSHSIFALPFALSMAVVVARTYPVSLGQILWILVALVAARTAAMAFNRIIDRKIDSQNPRTKNRELASGQVSLPSVIFLFSISSIIFHFAAWSLGRNCLLLAPLVLAFLCFYSWTKRFTSNSHLVLGVALALAPGGVWFALTGGVAWLPVLMMLAVMFWVAGFDIIYSCQDQEFDKKIGLFSLPSRLGLVNALRISVCFHLLTIICLLIFGYFARLGQIYFLGCAFFSVLLMNQHRIVNAANLKRVNEAFFTMNGFASVIFFLFVLLDSFL